MVKNPLLLPKHSIYGQKCNRTNLITVPDTYSTTNTDADLIVFVGFENEQGTSRNAYASVCLQSSDTRPIAGYIIFNIATLNYSSQLLEYNVNIATHELLHVLGVNLDLFPHFPKNSLGQDVLFQDIVTGNYFLKGDTLVQTARDHFGCQELTQVPMEDEGTTGNKGNHFEARIFGNDLMVPSAKVGYRLSKFSLAILQDSGWWDIQFLI